MDNQSVDGITEPMGGRAVHHRVFANEPSRAIVVDDELDRLVVPSVRSVAVPVGMSALFESHRRSRIQADDKRSGFNFLQRGGVVDAGRKKVFTSLYKLIARQRGQSAHRRGSLGGFVNLGELRFKLGGVELSSIDMSGNFEKLIVTDSNDVLSFGGRVCERIVSGLGRNAGGVEHVFVAGHGYGLFAHVFRLECAVDDFLLEFESSGSDGSSSFGRVASSSIVSEGVEVGDIRYNRISVCQICGFVPPVYYPILDLGLFCFCY